MKDGPDIAAVAALIADPARANMLAALTSGRAFTSGELAREAYVTPQTASGHLAKLREAGLVTATAQGRHRYHRLAGPEVAAALESLMTLAGRSGRLRTRPGPRDAALREARVCYDHVAGAAGVALFDALVAGGALRHTDGATEATEAGRRRLAAEGVDLERPAASRRPFCRACLDWSERRPHLAGLLGARMLEFVTERGWARRDAGSRALHFGPMGERAYRAFLARLADPASTVASDAA
jgi:DNA-binding transcriptional ArsR family regulator